MNRSFRGKPGAGLARALSKLGFCSRSRAVELVRLGKVRINGIITHDPFHPVDMAHDLIEVDEQPVKAAGKVYLMLNKPRGLVTTTSDEKGRATVFVCLNDSGLPLVSPVGRLDKASEGLLLLTNDNEWAARITNPASHLEKVYHVQVNSTDEALAQKVLQGVRSEGEFLRARSASVLRKGTRHSWLEITLTEGKNRHIRRLLAGFGVDVLRLVRVSIGPVRLGQLSKGSWRLLTADEIRSLGG